MASIWAADNNNAYKLNESGSQIVCWTLGNPCNVEGVGHDVDGCIWIQRVNSGFGTDNCVTEFNQVGSVQTGEISQVGSFTAGVTADTNNCIWVNNTPGGNQVAKFDQTGTLQTSFTHPSIDTGNTGMGRESTDSLWITAAPEESLYRFNLAGSQTSVIPEPTPDTCTDARGIGVDTNESLWIGGWDSDSIYQIDRTGTTQTQFGIPAINGVATEDEPLGAGGGGTTVTDTAVKTSVAHSPFQTTEVGIGTVQAVQEAFGHRSRKAQPAKVWFDTTEQWDSAGQNAVSHASDVVSITTGETEGFIIPSQQNWEG